MEVAFRQSQKPPTCYLLQMYERRKILCERWRESPDKDDMRYIDNCEGVQTPDSSSVIEPVKRFCDKLCLVSDCSSLRTMNEVSWWGSNSVLVGVPDEEDWAGKVIVLCLCPPPRPV